MLNRKTLNDTAFFVFGFVPIMLLAFNPFIVTVLISQKISDIKKQYEEEKVTS